MAGAQDPPLRNTGFFRGWRHPDDSVGCPRSTWMEPVIWTQRFATGHAGIDAQHQVLFRLLDRAQAGIGSPKAKDYRQIVLDLLKYIIEHFSYEYQLMREFGYPEQEQHHRYHQELTRQAVAFKEAIFAGQDAREPLAGFLVGWIQHHIAADDIRLADYLAKHGVAL